MLKDNDSYMVCLEGRSSGKDYSLSFWRKPNEGARSRFIYKGIYSPIQPVLWLKWEDGNVSPIRDARFEVALNANMTFNLTLSTIERNGKELIRLEKCVPAPLNEMLILPDTQNEQEHATDPSD